MRRLAAYVRCARIRTHRSVGTNVGRTRLGRADPAHAHAIADLRHIERRGVGALAIHALIVGIAAVANVSARAVRARAFLSRRTCLAKTRAGIVATNAVDTVAAVAFIAAHARRAVDLLRHARAQDAIVARCAFRVARTCRFARAHLTEIRHARDLHRRRARSRAIAGRARAERRGVDTRCRSARRSRRPLRAPSRTIACARGTARRLRRCCAFVIRIEVVSDGAANTVDPAAFFARRTGLAFARARVVATHAVDAVAIGAFDVEGARTAIGLLRHAGVVAAIEATGALRIDVTSGQTCTSLTCVRHARLLHAGQTCSDAIAELRQLPGR